MHMERKEEAMAAIEALSGTIFKGRQLAVELSKAQPLINQLVTGNSANPAAPGGEPTCFLLQRITGCSKLLASMTLLCFLFFFFRW